MEKIHAKASCWQGLCLPASLTSDPEVELVTTDSREVRPGCIFVAFPASGSTATTLRPKHWKRAQPLWW